VVYKEAWQIDVSAWNDSTNARVFCFNCNFAAVAEITVGADHFATTGFYDTTVIDWSNATRSKLIVTHDIIVRGMITAVGASASPLVAVRNKTIVELAVSVFGGTDIAISVDWT